MKSPEAPAVPEKACPSCGAREPAYALRCSACGHEWFHVEAAPRRRDPGVRLLLALAVALGLLLASLCLLFGIVHSYVRR